MLEIAVLKEKCIGCSYCKLICPVEEAITMSRAKAEINDSCILCDKCIFVCPVEAIERQEELASVK